MAGEHRDGVVVTITHGVISIVRPGTTLAEDYKVLTGTRKLVRTYSWSGPNINSLEARNSERRHLRPLTIRRANWAGLIKPVVVHATRRLVRFLASLHNRSISSCATGLWMQSIPSIARLKPQFERDGPPADEFARVGELPCTLLDALNHFTRFSVIDDRFAATLATDSREGRTASVVSQMPHNIGNEDGPDNDVC